MAATPPPTGSSPTAGATSGGGSVILGGRYRLEEKIASGGMAQVWRGTDDVLRRVVAIKILHPHLTADETFVARFRREAIAVARLSHPAIVNVYDTCSDGTTEAIVMEFVRGSNLRDRLDEGPLEPWAAAEVAAQVAGALAVAHASGLVHRDIKPANILLSDDGRVKVGDFGIAKAAESVDLTQTGAFVGTAKYLAPEQVDGKPVDGRTDLYSLGVVLYEMLCGRVPFEADSSPATALARLHRDPERPRLIQPDIPPSLEAITLRLLAREAADRPPSAEDARAQLVTASSGDRAAAPESDATVAGSLPAPPPPPPPPPVPPIDTPPEGSPRFADTERRWLIPTLLVLLVAISLGIAGLLLQRSGSLLGSDDDPPESSTTTEAAADPTVPVASVSDFDPLPGDGGEHPEEAELVIDGNPDTAWRTSEYRRPDLDWGGLKLGVGLIVELEEAADIAAIEVDSRFEGWSAEIYVADQAQGSLDAWDTSVGTIESATESPNRVELEEPVSGGAVLVWLTTMGDGKPQMEIAEIRVER